MKIKFVGVSSFFPGKGSEVVSFLINDKILVDTGWCNALKLEEFGLDISKLEYLFLTHLHSDHYIGLPQLLVYLGTKKALGIYPQHRPFTIIGPSCHIKHVVNSAIEFLQIKRFPEIFLKINIVPLRPGESYINNDFRLDTIPGKHVSGIGSPEEAFVTKFTELDSNKSFVFTGDTEYHPPIVDFAKGMPILIHDGCHCPAKKAAGIAKSAGVGKLFLVHHQAQHGKKILAQARAVFPKSFLPKDGDVITVTS